MRKRIGYIGLSTPVVYDYELEVETPKNAFRKMEHPILEGAFGLMLFYDELWFLARELCPLNMQNFSWVKFIDEMYDDIDFSSLVYSAAQYPQYDVTSLRERVNRSANLLDIVSVNAIALITHQASNVSSYLELGANTLVKGHPYNESSVLFDWHMLQYLREVKREEVEMVTNTFSQNMFAFDSDDQGQSPPMFDLITRLVIETDNYLSKDGPGHPSIDEVRSIPDLVSFRKWLLAEHGNLQQAEIQCIVEDVQKQVKEKSDLISSKYYDARTRHRTTAKTVFLTVLGQAIPAVALVSNIKNLIEEIKNTQELERNRWKGFLISAHEIIQSE